MSAMETWQASGDRTGSAVGAASVAGIAWGVSPVLVRGIDAPASVALFWTSALALVVVVMAVKLMVLSAIVADFNGESVVVTDKPRSSGFSSTRRSPTVDRVRL